MKLKEQESLQEQYTNLMQMIEKTYNKSEIEQFCLMANNLEECSVICFNSEKTYGN